MEGKHDHNDFGDQDPKVGRGSIDELDDGDNLEGDPNKKVSDEVKDLESSSNVWMRILAYAYPPS